MAYPTDLDNFTPKVDNVDDVNAVDVNELQTAIESLETKVGITGVGFNPASASASANVVLHEDTDNGTNKITVTAPSAIASNKTITLPDATGTLALLEIVYPVGIIIEFNVSTNPNTLLGFGTWSAYGTGRVTVAIDAGQTEFDTAGETGGAKTHTLTTTEIPSHKHNEKIRNPDGSTGSWAIQYNNNGGDVISTEYEGGGGAHNNLQPYIVVYRWVRVS